MSIGRGEWLESSLKGCYKIRVKESAFAPGFRISFFDLLILIGGMIGAVVAKIYIGSGGLIIGFVVGHFFLFCNVFRISRRPELFWAGTFTLLTASTLFTGLPGWFGTIIGSLVLTIALTSLEMRKPYYHGIGWRRVNPGLKTWWDSQTNG